MAGYKSGTNHSLRRQLHLHPNPVLVGLRMRGFYIFLHYGMVQTRVRTIEFSSRYEYFDENYDGVYKTQTLITNISLIFADKGTCGFTGGRNNGPVQKDHHTTAYAINWLCTITVGL